MPAMLYRELVSWYWLVDPPEDHADEGGCFTAAYERVLAPGPRTLLELGSGAGNNALHMKRRFTCTLSDLSEDMLALSRAQNPECEHIQGDMRGLRLGRAFDAVLVHDALAYITDEHDLRSVAQTAFLHTTPGGAAIFAPDCYVETFREDAEVLRGSAGERSLQGIMWTWDPDPGDSTYTVDFGLLLRDGATVTAVHDRHVEGVFPRATWQQILTEVGYVVEPLERPLGDGAHDKVFFCRRPR